MGSTIVELFDLVVAAGDDLIVPHYYGTNGYFARVVSETGLTEGLLHKADVEVFCCLR
jgi:hypothetical protein